MTLIDNIKNALAGIGLTNIKYYDNVYVINGEIIQFDNHVMNNLSANQALGNYIALARDGKFSIERKNVSDCQYLSNQCANYLLHICVCDLDMAIIISTVLGALGDVTNISIEDNSYLIQLKYHSKIEGGVTFDYNFAEIYFNSCSAIEQECNPILNCNFC